MEIDFITALGRLLRDGNLRDAFAANPQAAAKQVCLRQSDLPAWLQLVSEEVEIQATVLLRKRLDLVKFFAPETCRRAGQKLWPSFHQYARVNWPPTEGPRALDAFEYCRHLRARHPESIADREWNRLNFALSRRRAALYWVPLPARDGKMRRGIQLFWRGRGRKWRELFLYLCP